MPESIVDLSRELFTDIVLPILQQEFPNETERTAFGLFGYGSDAYLMDDELSKDIIHIVNGEIWHDPSGIFSAIRSAFAGHYPEPVRLRRIAHWCRYFSGMGCYALKRAILRGNEYYSVTRFATAIRLGVQLAFLLDCVYFPYDKWLMAYFQRLPRLYEPLHPLVDEAVLLSTSWERKLELLDCISDILDQTMVADGIIKPHAQYTGSATSGYRLLEHAYAELIQSAPEDIKTVVPVWDQIYLEQFH